MIEKTNEIYFYLRRTRALAGCHAVAVQER
ncbi:hypothetical protein ABMA09_03770 [Erwinia rhapontici]